jgi:cob(I)alamin adenosyltransferase
MIYFTGKGDKGKTNIGNKKFLKDSLIIETLGELDELNSLIGLSKNYLPKKFFQKLTNIQNDLFIIQANVASYLIYADLRGSNTRIYAENKKIKVPELKKEKIEKLEADIKRVENKIKQQNSFIIYGSNKNSAWFDYLRAKTRKVERQIVSFNKKYKLKPEILSYLNRLSSYFYAFAREICYNENIKEISPWY